MTAKVRYQYILLGTTLFIIIVTAIQVWIHGTDEESVRWLISNSAKLSAVLFAFAFVASGLLIIIPNQPTRLIMTYRPHLGLAFTVFHTFHLLFLIWLQWDIHPVFTLAKRSSLVGGGMAYGFMYLMATTTFPRYRRKLNPQSWKYLHTIGGYWIWFIFIKTYWRKVSTQGEAYLIFSLLLLVLLVRIYHLLTTRFKRNK